MPTPTKHKNPELGRNQHKIAPSARTPIKYVPVPVGCIAIWQVTLYDVRARPYPNTFREKSDAMQYADKLWGKHQGKSGLRIIVDMKAAILLGERFHLVHKHPLRFAEPVSTFACQQEGSNE